MSDRYSLFPTAKRVPNYGVLLFVLILLIVVAPLSTGEESAVVVEAFFDLVLISGAYWAASRRGHSWPFVVLTALTLLVRWSALFSSSIELEYGSAVITVIWIAFAIAIVVRDLFQQRQVNTNMIFGAVVAYLLAAIAFAYLYEILELSQPGSFSGIPDGGHPRELGNALLYFSLVSLTTMGYGDVVPLSNLARPLSVLEGVFGQLYLAVMIARLVGLHIHVGTGSDE